MIILRIIRGENDKKILPALTLLLLWAWSASAQQWLSAHSGVINYAEGVFYLGQERMQFPEARLRAIPQGQSVATSGGWVEVQLGPNSYLWMGEKGKLLVEDLNPSDIRIRIERGSILIALFYLDEKTRKNKIGISLGNAFVELSRVGLFRIDSDRSLVSVQIGKATILQAGKRATVRQGKAASLTNGMRISRFDRRQMDSLQENATRRSKIIGIPVLDPPARPDVWTWGSVGF